MAVSKNAFSPERRIVRSDVSTPDQRVAYRSIFAFRSSFSPRDDGQLLSDGRESRHILLEWRERSRARVPSSFTAPSSSVLRRPRPYNKHKLLTFPLPLPDTNSTPDEKMEFKSADVLKSPHLRILSRLCEVV